jgi:flagellin
MPQSILTNVPALSARRIGQVNAKELTKTQQTMASGSLVSDPSNAPSNAAIAQRLQAQTNGATVASQNAAQAESMFQLGAGAAANILEQAQRMRTLATQASNGLYTGNDVAIMSQEFEGLYAEIQREINTTSFNGVQILTPDFEAALQVGPNTTDDDRINVEAGSLDLQTPYNSLSGALDQDTLSNNLDIVNELDQFINDVSAVVGNIGAAKAKMDVVGKNLAIFVENNTAAKAIIADADIPEQLTKAQSLNALIDVSQTILQNTAESAKKLTELVKSGLR